VAGSAGNTHAALGLSEAPTTGSVLRAALLLGNLQYGFGRYWWIVLILVVDVVVNVAANAARARRRRALGLTRARRLWRMGLGPRPADDSRR